MQEIAGGVLGWMGTIGTFTAYVLMLRGTWHPTTKRYLVLNTVGGLLAAFGSLAYGAWPSLVSNVVWAVMGAYGLFVVLRRAVPTDALTPSAAVTAALPILPMPYPAWEPGSTVASSISLPWLQHAAELPSASAAAAGPSDAAAASAAPAAAAAVSPAPAAGVATLPAGDPEPDAQDAQDSGAVITDLLDWREFTAAARYA